jgi:predicted ArsR family transcriptional regulator
MDNKDHKRRQLIHTMLAQPAGATATEIAEHNLLPWRALARHLNPLIGENGFGALYGRTARLLAAQYGWLTTGPSSTSLETLFQILNDDLRQAGPARAAEANAALLLTLTGLLSELIGEALTTRLLDAAWGGGLIQKNAGEQK